MVAFTANKKLAVQSATEHPGTWGAGGTTGEDLNTGVMGLLDTQLAGVSAFSLSASNVSLSYAQVQTCFFRFTGVLLANIDVAPAVGDATTYFNGFYFFQNATTGSFTVTLTNASGSVTLPQGRSGIVFISATGSLAPRIIAGGNGDVPAGSKTLFYNTAAPSGWTAVALNDYAIKIVTAGLGGVTSGSVAYSTLYARTATDSHTLTTAQIPSHTHTFNQVASGFAGLSSGPSFNLGSNNASTAATGGGDGHTHDIDMRVQTAAFSLATRD